MRAFRREREAQITAANDSGPAVQIDLRELMAKDEMEDLDA